MGPNHNGNTAAICTLEVTCKYISHLKRVREEPGNDDRRDDPRGDMNVAWEHIFDEPILSRLPEYWLHDPSITSDTRNSDGAYDQLCLCNIYKTERIEFGAAHYGPNVD